MKAIILAAGQGTRIAPLSGGGPKCLLPLHGRSILEWQLDVLAACGVADVTIALGHRADAVRAAAGPRAQYITYPGYARTNNLHTLQHCRRALHGEIAILFADVLVERTALARCLASAADFTLLVDTEQRLPGTMRIRLAGEVVVDIGAHVTPEDASGNFVGIAAFSRRGTRLLRGEIDAMVGEGGYERSYYTEALARLAARGERVGTVRVEGARWREVDTEEDYRLASGESFYVV